MSDLTPEEQYKKEYDAELAKLDAAEQGKQPEPITAPVAAPEKTPEAAPPAAKVEAPTEPVTQPVETVEELRARLEKAEKQARDNQAWGTKQAQELAALKRDKEQRQREASRPAILDANPELAEAVRYVVSDDSVAQQDQEQQRVAAWQTAVQAVHPGILGTDIDPQLEEAIMARFASLGDEVMDPLKAIREITAEKEAFAVRKATERFAAEHAKQAEKSAMSVPTPGGGGGNRQAPDADADAAKRILNMSDADFEKEVRRVKGY